MTKPYTIRLFVPNGNPDEIKVIDKMNWTGVGIEVARSVWKDQKQREEFNQAGIYILIGYQEEADDLPTLYIGQGDTIRSRIDSHEKNKAFWDKALIFISSNRGLNRAHITWLEWALIQQAIKAARCNLDNSVSPNEPVLTESEKADTTEFLNEILSILPLVEIRVFEEPEKIKTDETVPARGAQALDTVVVPAQEDGFNRVFLGENSWYAIRIGGGMRGALKYIAAYQTAPVSAITHIAEIETIEPYGDGGKYKLNFKGPAKAIDPITYGGAKHGVMQSPRYVSLEKLNNSRTLGDLFD